MNVDRSGLAICRAHLAQPKGVEQQQRVLHTRIVARHVERDPPWRKDAALQIIARSNYDVNTGLRNQSVEAVRESVGNFPRCAEEGLKFVLELESD